MTKRYATLVELLKDAPKFPDKERAYEVKHGGKVEYVVSNSQGNAALEVCEVKTVTQRQLLNAYAEAVQKDSK